MSEKLENIRSISEAAQELILRQEEQGTDWADAVMVLLEKISKLSQQN